MILPSRAGLRLTRAGPPLFDLLRHKLLERGIHRDFHALNLRMLSSQTRFVVGFLRSRNREMFKPPMNEKEAAHKPRPLFFCLKPR